MKRSDRQTPNIVLARGRIISEILRLRAPYATLRRHAEGYLYAKIGEYCGLVHGNIREWSAVEGTVEGGTDGLVAAVALFRGLKRPLIDVGVDDGVHIYICNHDRTYEFNHRSGAAMRLPAPKRSVFAAYARFDPADARQEGTDGEIIGWEWVLADAGGLPEAWQLRYAERVW